MAVCLRLDRGSGYTTCAVRTADASVLAGFRRYFCKDRIKLFFGPTYNTGAGAGAAAAAGTEAGQAVREATHVLHEADRAPLERPTRVSEVPSTARANTHPGPIFQSSIDNSTAKRVSVPRTASSKGPLQELPENVSLRSTSPDYITIVREEGGL